MGRYGYLDMPDGWSDVDSSPVLAQCTDCGRVLEVEAEATWTTDGQRYTACGCADLWDYEAEALMYEHSGQCPWNRNQSDELEELTDPEDWDRCGDPEDYDYPPDPPDSIIPAGMEDADIYMLDYDEDDGWDQADLEWSSRCDRCPAE